MSSTALLTALLTLAPLPAPSLVCGPDALRSPEGATAASERGPRASATSEDERLRELWGMGETFDAFLENADRRREMWEANWETSEGIDAEIEAWYAQGSPQMDHFALLVGDTNTLPIADLPFIGPALIHGNLKTS